MGWVFYPRRMWRDTYVEAADTPKARKPIEKSQLPLYYHPSLELLIMQTVPSTTQAVVLVKDPNARRELDLNSDMTVKAERKNTIQLVERDIPQLKEGEVLVRIAAAAFNHRELWMLRDSYPGMVDRSVMGADGAGVVIAAYDQSDILLGKRVFLVPMRGWEADPRSPEGAQFGVLGGGSYPPIGTWSEYVVVERDQVIEVPQHMDLESAAAWPLCGVTAWRAVSVKGQVSAGQNVLIVGIGGGVAMTCFQLCLALGANVYVTSSDQAKIDNAVALGAKGGVNYKSDNWADDLGALLQKHSPNTPLLDVIIDQAGGDIAQNTSKFIRIGGYLVCYGMHAVPKITFTVTDVIKNIELKGTAMGSRKDLEDATAFIAKHKVKPIVAHVIEGLEKVEEGFDLLSKVTQMGKIVIRVGSSPNAPGGF